MSPFYQDVDINTRERKALEPGSYGTSTQPGLKILSYISNASKLDQSGAMQHSFLVAATRPSREQLQKAATNNGNGATPSANATPFDEPDYEGTAFLQVTVHPDWTHPAALALAFTEASRSKKDGTISRDFVAEGAAAGDFDKQVAIDGETHYRKIATDKVIAANTPGDNMQEAVDAQYRKEMQRISISIGELFALQDWMGVQRDPSRDPITLVGAEFSGKVEVKTSNTGKTSNVITSVYGKKKESKK